MSGIQRMPLKSQAPNDTNWTSKIFEKNAVARTDLISSAHQKVLYTPPPIDSEGELFSDSTVTFGRDSEASPVLMTSVTPRAFYGYPHVTLPYSGGASAQRQQAHLRPQQLEELSQKAKNSTFMHEVVASGHHRPPSSNQNATSVSDTGLTVDTTTIKVPILRRKEASPPQVLGLSSAHVDRERLTTVAIASRDTRPTAWAGGRGNEDTLIGALRSSSFSAQSSSSALSSSAALEFPTAVASTRPQRDQFHPPSAFEASTAAPSPVGSTVTLPHPPHVLKKVVMPALNEPRKIGSAPSFLSDEGSAVASWLIGSTASSSVTLEGDAVLRGTGGPTSAPPPDSRKFITSPAITPFRGRDMDSNTHNQNTPSSQANADSSHTISPQKTPASMHNDYSCEDDQDVYGEETPMQKGRDEGVPAMQTSYSPQQRTTGSGAGNTDEDRETRERILAMLLSGTKPTAVQRPITPQRKLSIDHYVESDDHDDDSNDQNNTSSKHPQNMNSRSYPIRKLVHTLPHTTVASGHVNTSTVSASSSVTLQDDINALQYTSTRDHKKRFVDAHCSTTGVGAPTFNGAVEQVIFISAASGAENLPSSQSDLSYKREATAYRHRAPQININQPLLPQEISPSYPSGLNATLPATVLQYGPPKVSDTTRRMYENLFDPSTLSEYPPDLMLWRMRAQAAGVDPYNVPAQSIERAAMKAKATQEAAEAQGLLGSEGLFQRSPKRMRELDEDNSKMLPQENFSSILNSGNTSQLQSFTSLTQSALTEAQAAPLVAVDLQARTQFISAETRASFWTRRRSQRNLAERAADEKEVPVAYSSEHTNSDLAQQTKRPSSPPRGTVNGRAISSGTTSNSPTRRLYASPPSINYSKVTTTSLTTSATSFVPRGKLSFAAEYYTDPLTVGAVQKVLGPMISPDTKTDRGQSLSPLDPHALTVSSKKEIPTPDVAVHFVETLRTPSGARSPTATPPRQTSGLATNQHIPVVLSPSGYSERSYVPPSNLVDLNVANGYLTFGRDENMTLPPGNKSQLSRPTSPPHRSHLNPEDAAILYDLYRIPTHFVTRHPPSPRLTADVTQMDDMLSNCRTVRGVARGERGVLEAKEAAVRASSMAKLFEDVFVAERRQREDLAREESSVRASLNVGWERAQQSLAADELLKADAVFRQRLWKQQESEWLLLTLTFTTGRLRLERSESVANEIRESQINQMGERGLIEAEEVSARSLLIGNLFTALTDTLVFEESRERVIIGTSSHAAFRFIFEDARAEKDSIELQHKTLRRAAQFRSARLDVEEEELFQRQTIVDQSMAHRAHIEQLAEEAFETTRRVLEAKRRMKTFHSNQRDDFFTEEGNARDHLGAVEAAARLALSRQFVLLMDLSRVEEEESNIRRQITADQLSYRADLATTAAKNRNVALRLQEQREAAEASERALQEKRRRAQKARPFIGLTLAERMIEGRLSPSKGGSSPLVIDALTVGGPAHRKGLALGDIVISVAGELAVSLLQVRGIMAKKAVVGETIEIVVRKPTSAAVATSATTLPKRRATVGGEYLEREMGNSPQFGARSAGASTAASRLVSLNGSMASLSSAVNHNDDNWMSTFNNHASNQTARSPLDLGGSFAEGNASTASNFGADASSSASPLPPARTFLVPVMTADEEFADLAEWYFDINKHKQITREMDPSVVLRSVCSFKAKQSSAQNAAATAAAVAAMTGLQTVGSTVGSRASTPTSRPRSTSYGGNIAVPEFGIFVREESTQSGWNNSTSGQEHIGAYSESAEPSPRRTSVPVPMRQVPTITSPVSSASTTSPTSLKSVAHRGSVGNIPATISSKLTSPPNRASSSKDLNAPLSHRSASKGQLLAKPTPSRRPSATAKK